MRWNIIAQLPSTWVEAQHLRINCIGTTEMRVSLLINNSHSRIKKQIQTNYMRTSFIFQSN